MRSEDRNLSIQSERFRDTSSFCGKFRNIQKLMQWNRVPLDTQINRCLGQKTCIPKRTYPSSQEVFAGTVNVLLGELES